MKTLTALLLTLLALPAFAGSAPHYDRGPSRELLHASRSLDEAAVRLHRELRERQGRSAATWRARELVEATRDFRRLAERDAPPRRLHETYRRVEARQARLEDELHGSGWMHPRSGLVAGLRDLDRAVHRAGRVLERRHYAWRDDRNWHDPHGRWPSDRREPWPYR